MNSLRKLLVPALATIAMLVAAASIGFASAGPYLPKCGEHVDYYSDASHTTLVGFREKEPVDPCGCTGFNNSGSTSIFHVVTNQPYCL